MKKCPFCEKDLIKNGVTHIYACGRLINQINRKEIRFLYIKYNFPTISIVDVLKNEYIINKKSLPKIKEVYRIDFKSIVFLLKYFGFSLRGYSESCLLSVNERKQSCIEKYGVDNPSKSQIIKQKKQDTFMKNYGVDNIRKWPGFPNQINEAYIKKYGENKSTIHSRLSKEVWSKKTTSEKEDWLNKSILSINSHRNNHNKRKKEKEIKKHLEEIGYEFEYQFKVENKFFDFKLGNFLLEFNGDYWHCNPKKYKEDDLVPFPSGKIFVKDIWERDRIKKEIGEKNGYTVFYIWEDELNLLSIKDKKTFIKEFVDENCKNQIN